jgi:hypothetical protein
MLAGPGDPMQTHRDLLRRFRASAGRYDELQQFDLAARLRGEPSEPAKPKGKAKN